MLILLGEELASKYTCFLKTNCFIFLSFSFPIFTMPCRPSIWPLRCSSNLLSDCEESRGTDTRSRGSNPRTHRIDPRSRGSCLRSRGIDRSSRGNDP